MLSRLGRSGFLMSILFQPEEFWFSAPRKGIMVFALPGERGLAELAGDFKVHFHDRQGDFYWFVTCLSSLLFEKSFKFLKSSLRYLILIFG